MQLACDSQRRGAGHATLCPSTSLKPDPGLRILPCRLPSAPTPLPLFPAVSFIPPHGSLADGAPVYRDRPARSFDYCFVKCNVKDSTITPICPAAIVPAIKAVVLALVRHCSPVPSFSPFLQPFAHPPSNCNELSDYLAAAATLTASSPCSLEFREGASVVCANSNLSPGHVLLRSELRTRSVERVEEARVAT